MSCRWAAPSPVVVADTAATHRPAAATTSRHTTKNGTYVEGHYQSIPNSSKSDNWSTTGNVNPYTGKTGTKADDGSVSPSGSSTPAYAAPSSASRLAQPTTAYRAAPLYTAPRVTSTRSATRLGARSSAAKTSFQHAHPCPSTARRSGSCSGYVIDHVTPLCAGCADAASNMQWQSVAEAKRKDVSEKRMCAKKG